MKYDIVIVLCPDKKNLYGKFPEFKNGKYLGGQTRMNAAVVLSQENKKTIFILVGGHNEDDGITDSDYYKKSQKTADMRQYFLEKGIENKRLKIVNSLPCTKHNLVAVFKKYSKRLDKKKKLKIGLLTNFYHLPRALNFWRNLVCDEFQSIVKNPTAIIAESIIGGDRPYYKEYEYFLRLESELKGLIDLNTDRYKDKCLKEGFFRIINGSGNKLLTRKDKKLLSRDKNWLKFLEKCPHA